MKKVKIASFVLAIVVLCAAVGGVVAAWTAGARLDGNIISIGSVDLKVTDSEGGTIPINKTLNWVDVDYSSADYAMLNSLAGENKVAKAEFSIENASGKAFDVMVEFDTSKYTNTDGVASCIVAWLYEGQGDTALADGISALDLTTTYRSCSNFASHEKRDYTLFMLTPKSLQNGFAANKDFKFDVAATATDHSYADDKTEYVVEDSKFYRVCDNGCGTRGDLVPHYGDRYVAINGEQYFVDACYKEHLDKGITYDPIKGEFVVPIKDNYNGSYEVAAYEDNVVLYAEKDVTIGPLTFTNRGGVIQNTLKVVGNHKITVKGSISVANVLTVLCDMDLPAIKVGDFGVNNAVVIGNADNTVQPTVTVTANGDGGVESRGDFALDYKVLSGKMVINQSTSGNVGISLHNANDVVTVGEHGTLEINGFTIGIATWDGPLGAVKVYGTLNIDALPGGDNGALRDVVVTVGDSEAGYQGRLNLLSTAWGIMGGELHLINGSAKLEFSPGGSGYAAFNNVKVLTVRNGFDLSIISFSIGVYGSTPTFDIQDGVIITVTKMRDIDGDPLKSYYQNTTPGYTGE